MKRSGVPDAIDFPANPFVALSDFVMVVLLLVVLGFVYQSVSTNRFLERVAVENAQARLFSDLTGKASSEASRTQERQALIAAYEASPKRFNKIWVDGDLQRFWFDGALLYKDAAGLKMKKGKQRRFRPKAVAYWWVSARYSNSIKATSANRERACSRESLYKETLTVRKATTTRYGLCRCRGHARPRKYCKMRRGYHRFSLNRQAVAAGTCVRYLIPLRQQTKSGKSTDDWKSLSCIRLRVPLSMKSRRVPDPDNLTHAGFQNRSPYGTIKSKMFHFTFPAAFPFTVLWRGAK